VPWYHERGHRRGAGRRRGLITPPVYFPPPDPGDPPDPPPAATFIPGWPVPAATSAWNMAMSQANRRGFFRFSFARASPVDKIGLHLKCGTSGGPVAGGSNLSDYGKGDTGLIQFRLSLADPVTGAPDLSNVLATDGPFRPGWYSAVDSDRADSGDGIVYMALNGYTPGSVDELVCLEWWNAHADPSNHWFSINALHDDTGPHGSYAANNLLTDYANATAGRDPRTCTGWSTNGGASWNIPGGPFGGQWNAAYAVVYDDGAVQGQPTYYATTGVGTDEAQVLKLCGDGHVFTHLGWHNVRSGSPSTISVVRVNPTTGALIETFETLNPSAAAGGGRVALADPITTDNAHAYEIRLNASGRGFRAAIADGVWDDLLGLSSSGPYYRRANPDHSLPIWLEPIPDNAAWRYYP
jgi:hypothetical protein